MAIEVLIQDKETVAALTSIYQTVRNPEGMLRVVGRRGANELKRHFQSKNTVPNKLGGRRTNWWRSVADSVQNPVSQGTGRVRISVTEPGIGLQYFGGRVTPVRAKALTIPVAPEAHGVTAAVLEQRLGIRLFIPRKKGGGLSNLLAGFTDKGRTAKFKVFYVLAKSADVPADPTALPRPSDFQAAILDEAQNELQKSVAKAGSQGRTTTI